MKDSRIYLKVKLKSLAAEAKIIRHEERRNKRHRSGLAEHRRTVVRQEARLTLLAYGFLKGTPYDRIERSEREPDWSRVKKMIEKYGVCEGGMLAREQQARRFEAWKPSPEAPAVATQPAIEPAKPSVMERLKTLIA